MKRSVVFCFFVFSTVRLAADDTVPSLAVYVDAALQAERERIFAGAVSLYLAAGWDVRVSRDCAVKRHLKSLKPVSVQDAAYALKVERIYVISFVGDTTSIIRAFDRAGVVVGESEIGSVDPVSAAGAIAGLGELRRAGGRPVAALMRHEALLDAGMPVSQALHKLLCDTSAENWRGFANALSAISARYPGGGEIIASLREQTAAALVIARALDPKIVATNVVSREAADGAPSGTVERHLALNLALLVTEGEPETACEILAVYAQLSGGHAEADEILEALSGLEIQNPEKAVEFVNSRMHEIKSAASRVSEAGKLGELLERAEKAVERFTGDEAEMPGCLLWLAGFDAPRVSGLLKAHRNSGGAEMPSDVKEDSR